MSSSVPSRPLSLIPFLVADGVLLLTALLVAWGASGELAGGALLGVIVCTGLGAVLTVLPFVLNDAREREAALAARQRELVDLVNSSTATASHWGTQWTAAATGLESAAGLATRNIAAAEHLPVVFQEKIDAFARLLDQAEVSAHAREERAAEQAAALATRSGEAGAVAAALARTLAGFDLMKAGLGEQHAAITETLAKVSTADAKAGAVVAVLERTLAGFSRAEAALRDQHTALAATLAEFPAAGARAQSARAELDERLSSAPAQIEAHVARVATEAEGRLAATTDALTLRLAGLETALSSLIGQLERVKTLAVPESVPTPVPVITPAPSVVAEVAASAPAMPAPESERAPDAPPKSVPREKAVLAVSAAPVGEAPAAKPVRTEAIMDPFYIPSDGYASLADAMDAGRS